MVSSPNTKLGILIAPWCRCQPDGSHIGSMWGGSDSLLAGWKRGVPTYIHFSSAGTMDVCAALRTPEDNITANAIGRGANNSASAVGAPCLGTAHSQVGAAMGALFAVLLALATIVVLVFMFRCHCEDEGRDGSTGKKATFAIVDRYKDSECSRDYDDVYKDNLLSQFYSNSSRFDPDARLRELRGFKGVSGGVSVGKGSSSNSPKGGGDIFENCHGHESRGAWTSTPSCKGGASHGSRISLHSGAATRRYSQKSTSY
jgi:hypothetical protein